MKKLKEKERIRKIFRFCFGGWEDSGIIFWVGNVERNVGLKFLGVRSFLCFKVREFFIFFF